MSLHFWFSLLRHDLYDEHCLHWTSCTYESSYPTLFLDYSTNIIASKIVRSFRFVEFGSICHTRLLGPRIDIYVRTVSAGAPRGPHWILCCQPTSTHALPVSCSQPTRPNLTKLESEGVLVLVVLTWVSNSSLQNFTHCKPLFISSHFPAHRCHA